MGLLKQLCTLLYSALVAYVRVLFWTYVFDSVIARPFAARIASQPPRWVN